MNTLYSILGVPEKASASDIRKAYRQLMLRVHPDRNPGVDIALSQHANRAYSILGNASERAKYDAWLAQQRTLRPIMPQQSIIFGFGNGTASAVNIRTVTYVLYQR